jgi:hypothetical protein
MTAVLPVRRPGAAAQLPPAEDKRPAAGIAGTARHYMGLIAPWLVRGLLGLAVLTFALLAIGPHVFGYRTMTMLTGSMAPEINPGDVTIVTPIAVSEVTEGMVITYHRTAASAFRPRATPTRRPTPGRRRWRATRPTRSAPSSRCSAT